MGVWSRWPVLDRVVVNLIDGRAIEGVLFDRRGPLLVVADARLHEPGVEPTRMDGQIFIERDQVAFIQAGLPKGG